MLETAFALLGFLVVALVVYLVYVGHKHGVTIAELKSDLALLKSQFTKQDTGNAASSGTKS